MSFTRVVSGRGWLGVSWQAGEGLLLVAGETDEAGRMALSGPGEWTLLGMETAREWSDFWGYWASTTAGVWVWNPTVSGSGRLRVDLVQGDEPVLWALYRADAPLYSSASQRVQNQQIAFPGLVGVPGDVVRIAHCSQEANLPSGETREWAPAVDLSRRAWTTGDVPSVTVGPRSDGRTWTLLFSSRRRVPAPVIVSPSAVAPGVGLVEWQPIDGVTVARVRRTQGASVTYWTGSAWSASVSQVAAGSSSVSVTHAAGAWTLDVQVGVGADWSAWSAPQSLVVAADPLPPTVSVSSWTVRRPTVTVAGSAGAGATLSGIRVEVVQAGTVLESVLVPPGSWQPGRLPDGPTTIRAAVVQNGDQQGPWASVSGTVAVPPVPAPTVTAAVQYHADTIPPGGDHTDGLPGIRLSITTSLVDGVVEVSRDGRILTAGTISGALEVDDYAPGTDYRVRVGDASVAPVEWSPWTSVALPANFTQEHWLIAPQYPELSVRLRHHVYDEVSPNLRAQTNVWLDDPTEHITYGVPVRARGKRQFGAESRWAWERLSALLSSGLLLRMGYCPSLEGVPTPPDVFRVDGYSPSRFIPTLARDLWRVDVEVIPQDN